MEVVTLTALAALLAPYFQKAGETLATETVKLCLEKRQDIKVAFVNLFKPDEIITLGLDKSQTSEEIKALQEANPDVATEVQKKIEDNSALLDELATVLSKHEGREIHATNYFENVNTINIDQRRS